LNEKIETIGFFPPRYLIYASLSGKFARKELLPLPGDPGIAIRKLSTLSLEFVSLLSFIISTIFADS
jgi:hypothetical protein